MKRRSYKRALEYGKKEGYGKFERSSERLTMNERSGLYDVQEEITFAIDKMAMAADFGVRRSSISSVTSVLVDTFIDKTLTKSLAFLRKKAADWGLTVPDTKGRLATVKSRCLIGGYIRRYEILLWITFDQRVVVAGSFKSSGDEGNSSYYFLVVDRMGQLVGCYGITIALDRCYREQ